MRKFTLILASMFLTLGTWAQSVATRMTAEQLNAVTEKLAIAIECTQITNSNSYYNGSGRTTETGDGIIFYWVPVVNDVAGTYYIMKGDGENDYLQSNNITTFGTMENAAKFHAVKPYNGGAGVENFGGGDCFYNNTDEERACWVRLAFFDDSKWFNFNGFTYNTGPGVWTVQFVHDMSGITDITYTLADKAGNEYSGTYRGIPGSSQPAFTGAAGYSLDNVQWDGNDMTAEITFPFPVSKVDGATNATLLSSYNNAQQWHAVNENVLVQTAGANLAELDYWMWAIYPAFNDGAFTFTIKNIATGLFVTAHKTGSNLDTSDNDNTGADGAVTLTETGTAFSIPSERDFAFTINDVTAYLSINSNKDTDVNLGVHTGAHNGTNVLAPSFEQLEKYQVTIGSTGYSTLYTPIKVTVPDGITAYTGELNGEWLTLTEVGNVIPANTAVVLQGTANTYTFSASSAEAAEIANNALTGSTETVATSSVEGTVYTLQSNGEGGVVFRKYTGDNLSGFKAYLDLPTVTPAIGIRFEDGTTAIDNVQLSTDNVVIYDLSGRRVEKMEKGIYIVNGKKVIR